METMKWDCDVKIEQMVINTQRNIDDYIDMLYIQAVSKLLPNIKRDTTKRVTPKLIEEFLQKRGYSMNYILRKRVMIKAFTCVYIRDGYVEVWHDITNNNKSVFVNENLLTGLPIILNYMERI